MFSIGAGLQHGFIFAHSPGVQNTKGARPTGAELIFSWQRNDPAIWNLCNCYPRQGFVINYYNYDTEILGSALSSAFFLEPSFRISKKFQLSFEASAGLSYLTNPFDSVHNPGNQSYSTKLSGYLLVGGGVWYKMADHFWLNGSVNYQHISNGGFRQPNKGINWPTVGLAISYQKEERSFYSGKKQREKYWKNDGPRWDLGVFGIAKRIRDQSGNSKRLPLIGISAQGSKQIGGIHALTAGLEVFYDDALKMKIENDSIPTNESAVRSGILIGHEFLLGKFIFSQRLGVYIFNPTDYFTTIYHRWGIQYRFNKNWGAGFHLQAHKHVADFIDLRIVYSLQKKEH
ncbi:acyloxyacyl hydrolase [Flavitalea antarctica]